MFGGCFVDILVSNRGSYQNLFYGHFGIETEAAVKIANSQLLQSVMIMKLDLRKSAPFATVMHMLPVDKGEALAVEMDMVWHSGSCVTIETQVDMRDSHAQEKMVAQAEEPGLAAVAAMALLTGFEKDYMIPQAAGISAAAMTEAPHKRRHTVHWGSCSQRWTSFENQMSSNFL